MRVQDRGNRLAVAYSIVSSLAARTPLALVLIALSLGIHCSPHLDPIMGLGVGIVFVALGGLLAQVYKTRCLGLTTLATHALLLSVVVLLGAALRSIHERRLGLQSSTLAQPQRVVSYSGSQEEQLKVRLLDGPDAGKFVRLRLTEQRACDIGDTLLVAPLPASAPSSSASSMSERSQGIAARLTVRCVGYAPLRSTSTLVGSPRLLGRRLQMQWAHRLEETLGGRSRTSSLISALALGYLPRGEDSQELRQSFARSGVAHVLAVSGFHLGIVALLLSLLLVRLVGLRHGGRTYISCMLLGVWGFTLISGWAVPTIRASLMLSLYLLGRALGRNPRLPNILALSALIQLLLSPYALYSVGFALSYSAVLSIYLLYAPLYESVGYLRHPIFAWLWQGLSLCLSAQVLVLPLCLYYWGTSSLAFVWSSVPMGLLAMILLPLSWLFLGLSTLPLPTELLIEGLNSLAGLMLRLSDYLGTLPYTSLSLERNNPWFLALYASLLLPSWLLHRAHERRAIERYL